MSNPAKSSSLIALSTPCFAASLAAYEIFKAALARTLENLHLIHDFLQPDSVYIDFFIELSFVFLVLLDDTLAESDASSQNLELVLHVFHLIDLGMLFQFLVGLRRDAILHVVDRLQHEVDRGGVHAGCLHGTLHLTRVLNLVHAVDHPAQIVLHFSDELIAHTTRELHSLNPVFELLEPDFVFLFFLKQGVYESLQSGNTDAKVVI
eukprot:CAMPEP_0170462292 /NCGR_PEP_ID=MMETSP0123-20130129/7856_1 /TAXON_ID=182087 /ORGANISM="Favella ehrenbergii, Strain Fehren 1" /LENGTH=206 /DNA_ID=CAMNT_0010727483 /DNA_START=1720 /DNA_END=2339 /DNA_ORIENTATION=-